MFDELLEDVLIKKKPTDINIAKFFNSTPQTLGNWKRSKDKAFNHRYMALKEYFIKLHSES